MKKLHLDRRLICLAFLLIWVFLFSFLISELTLSDPVDTLDLQLQWTYPIKIADMKLVDFNNDGINEILVGFKSDSSRVGILDVISQTMVWQSPAFHGTIYTVATGDRNNDGYLDIIYGGQRSDSSIGYIEVFDGPTFASTYSYSGFDHNVLSASISTCCLDSLPKVFLGTQLNTFYGGEWQYLYKKIGKLYVLDGRDLTLQDVSSRGAIREILMRDINNDTHKELFLGMDHWETYEDYLSPDDYTVVECWIAESTLHYSHNFNFYGEFWQGAYSGGGLFDALEVGSFNGGVSNCVIGSSHLIWGWGSSHAKGKLACWSEPTAELKWSIEWKTGNYITDLAICYLNSEEANAICAAYQNGLIEFRNGSNGNILAISPRPHSIYHMKLGNVDQDKFAEICVTSGDSLYVYKTELWPRNDPPLVSDIPNQTIAEDESFASIRLDDYVTDPDDADSVMIWSHWGETVLLVDITDRVATVISPNPEWNGVETIWFKASDPGGLCDSDQAILTVRGVNDTPMVSDIPNQTITEGDSFTSINLDDYVTDPDSVIVWSHWGETGLLVDITDRVATVTPHNPDWSGAETIWFKACDPGELCDSDQAIFTVTAMNDTPVISDIPNQTIAEGENFISISLDEYVTDPDDPDSVMVWSHWGETELLVNITNRVATVIPPNPEWNGVETVWFRACDPEGLCDSSKPTFAVHPERFCLFQNYPNPFNPQTNIRFDVPLASNVTITIYSILGEKVREFEKHYEAGTHTLMWDGKNSSGKDVASGVYIYKLSAGNYQETRKMVLIR